MADWDLNAVVRSCKYATNTATNSATSANIITTPTNTSTPALEDDPLLDWLKSEEVSGDDALYSFPSLLEPRANAFKELEQFYQPFFPNPTTTNNNFSTITNTHVGIIPNSPIISDFGGGSSSGHQQHHLQQQQQQQQHLFLPTNTTTISPPHFNPPGFGGLFRSHQQQVQQVLLPKQENQIHQQGFLRPNQAMNPALPLPRLPLPMHTHTPRSRKRKSQQKRMVCEVTAENLSSDLWAWRKYGQKPIKGSPHPRNYYRCSSSKGCAARKQVERSTTDPDIFVVTYTGDHTHPPPTHRNSLAGSTRNKLSQKQPISKDSVSGSPTAAAANNHSSWSPLSADLELDDDDMENINEDGNGNEDEADVLISNMDAASQEMIIMGLEQLDSSSIGGGGSLAAGASGDSFLDQRPSHLGSSWAAANCSSAAGATVGGGY